MRTRSLSLFLLMACTAFSTATANDETVDIPGKELRELISDSTVTGRHNTGMPYSEWHAPDGRVFGHNNRVANENACWDIKDNAVCYYYKGGVSTGVYCWAFNRVSDNGFRLRSIESSTTASGIWQAGNPYEHSDNGKPWSCEPLSSQNMTPRVGPKPGFASFASLMKQ